MEICSHDSEISQKIAEEIRNANKVLITNLSSMR